MGSKRMFKGDAETAAAMQQLQRAATEKKLRRRLSRTPEENHVGYRTFLKACISDVQYGELYAA